ncbi:MAG: hypothetical protein DRN05_02240, partial [Thermoplasmata archaeon]
WSYTTGGSIASTPAVAYGKVYIGSDDKKVYCFDADNGSLQWTFDGATSYIRSSPAVADNKVYVGSFDGNIYCLDATDGSLIWSHALENSIDSSPAIVNDTLYIGSAVHAGEQGIVYAFKYTPPPPQPEIKIGDINGGLLRISAVIENTGDADANNVNWSISVKGGILGLVNKTSSGTISVLKAGENETVTSEPLLGFGPIEINITASEPSGSSDTKTVEAFLFIFFIITPQTAQTSSE